MSIGSGLQTSRARSALVSARSVQAESEQRFFVLGRDEPSPRIDLISENGPRRAHVTPRRDRERDLGSRLISARLGSSRKSRKSGMYHTKCAYDSDREAEWVLQLSYTTSTALYHTKCAQSTDLESNWVLQLTNTAMKLSLTLTLWS